MAGKGQLVLAFFESEEAADTAVDALNQWAKTNRRVELDAIGVLAKDDAGNVKTHKPAAPAEASSARFSERISG